MERPLVVQAKLGSAKKQQQQALAAIARLPVKEQLAFHFPYDVTSKFPGYIWQTWKYTPSSRYFLDKFRPPEASWTEKHPTFVHEVTSLQQ
jgi:alpha 1,6-mannosyltransferase